MKTKVLLIFSIFSVIFLGTVSAQLNTNDSVKFSKRNFDTQINHFLVKGKKQKTLAWVLLGGSFLLATVSTSTDSYGSVNNNQAVAVISNVALIGSVPMFFSSSGNKNKAQLIRFEKDIAFASSDSIKKIYIEDASEYFLGKGRGNTTTAIVLSAVGGAFLIAGLTQDRRNDLLFDDLSRVLYTFAGITAGALSIPFYVRGSNLKRTANGILRTGRIPKTVAGSISPSVNLGQYVAVGISIQL